MPSKSITESFKVFDNASMSGTITVTSLVTNVKYRDSVAYQFNWTGGIPSGSFSIQGSLDYNPGIPTAENPSGGANPGTWNSITLSPSPAATGSGSYSYLVALQQVTWPYLRAQYTNTSGSGLLTGYIFAKSLGL